VGESYWSCRWSTYPGLGSLGQLGGTRGPQDAAELTLADVEGEKADRDARNAVATDPRMNQCQGQGAMYVGRLLDASRSLLPM
jgi:hypothetical protein